MNPKRRTSRVALTAVAAMAVAVVVAAVVVATHDDPAPRAAAGRTITLERLVPGAAATMREVRQPWGVLLVNLAFVDKAAGFQAPVGGRFARVTVARTPVATDRYYLPSMTVRPDRSSFPVAAVSVLDGAHEFPVRFAGPLASAVLAGIDPPPDPTIDPRESGVSAVVALPDKAERVRLKIDYDGVARVVDVSRPQDRPVPAALADLTTTLTDRVLTTSPDWSPRGRAVGAEATLRVTQSQLTPYLVGRGWAPAGSSWWSGVLDASPPARLSTSGGGYLPGVPSTTDGYRTTDAAVVTTTGGLSRDGAPSGLPAVAGERLVARVDDHAAAIRVQAAFPIRSKIGAAPARRFVTATWTVPIR